jgi:hypothetical protein
MSENNMTRDPASRQQTGQGSLVGEQAKPSDAASAPSLGDIKRQATEDLGAVREAAAAKVEEASDKAAEMANEQKTFLAQQLSSLGEALERTGRDMQSGDGAAMGRYAGDMGSSIRSFASDIEGRDMGEIAAMAEDYGRRQPLAFLGLAAVAGLAASRFVTASARRRDRETQANQSMKPTPGLDRRDNSATLADTTLASTPFSGDRANVQY